MSSDRNTAPPAVYGMSVMLLSVMVAASTDGMVKWLSASYPILEIAFFRSIFTFLPAGAVVMQCGGIGSLRTRRFWLHVVRAVFGSAAMLSFFYSYSVLPMADVTVLGQTYPLFLVAISRILLGDPVSRGEWCAVAAGFLGVAIIVQPGSSVFNWYSLLPLMGSACMVGFLLLLRILSTTESKASLIIYVPTVTAIMTAVSLHWVWKTPHVGDWWLLAAMGVFGGVALHLRNIAYSAARPAALAPVEYLQILFASAIGILVFAQAPSRNLWIGAVPLIAGNLYIVRMRIKRVAQPIRPVQLAADDGAGAA